MLVIIIDKRIGEKLVQKQPEVRRKVGRPRF
jgi:hypothetical protein